MMSEERMIYGGEHRLEQPATLPWIAEGQLGWCRSKTSWDDFAYYRHGTGEMATPIDHACGNCPVLVHHVTGPALSNVDATGCRCGACLPPQETMAGPWPAPENRTIDDLFDLMQAVLRDYLAPDVDEEAQAEARSWLDAIQRRTEKRKARG